MISFIGRKRGDGYYCLTMLLVLVACLTTNPVSSMATTSGSSSNKKVKAKSAPKTGFGVKPVVFTHKPDTSPEMKALLKFLIDNKAEGLGEGAGTEVGYSMKTNMRGMYATTNFKKGDILCRIPSDCALAVSDPGLAGADVPTMAHEGRNLLDMYLHNEKAVVTWAPYLATLPYIQEDRSKSKNFDPTPDFFSPEEIEQLEFPRAVARAKERREAIEAVSKEDDIPFDDIQFATWLVSSRSFSISMQVEEEGPEGALKTDAATRSVKVLLPYLDMVNHNSNNANCELHLIDPEKDEAWFALRAKRKIAAGKEITIAYGSGVDSSIELLCKYGFVPAENKCDALMLKKGGDDYLEKDEWKTSIEEDREALASAEGNMKKVLAFRIKLKESYP